MASSWRSPRPIGGEQKERWVKELPEVIWFVELVISKYGKEYGVDLGLHLKGIGHPFGEDRWMRHGNASLELSLGDSSVVEIRMLLNLKHEMDGQERTSCLIEVFERMLPLFRGCETVDGAMKEILSMRIFAPNSPVVEEYLKRHK